MSTRASVSPVRALAAIALALLVGFAATVAIATPAQAYTYTVRVWAGNHGTVNGSDKLATKTGFKYGEVVRLDKLFNVKVVNDSDTTKTQYYVKGFRLSGTDNQNKDGSSNLRASVTVTEDVDFVVSYGVKGKMVKYKAEFVEDSTGKKLAADVTYEGMPGDKPVVAYEFIRGYRPLYRNITKTLQEDESENVFTFRYVKLAPGQTESGTPTTPTTPQQQQQAQQQQQGTGTPTPTPGAQNEQGTNQNQQNEQNGQNAQNQQQNQQNQQNEQNLDQNGNPQTEEVIDEDVTPLASTTSTDNGTEKNEQGTSEGGIPMPAIIAAILAILAAAAGILYFLLKRRQEESDYDYQ